MSRVVIVTALKEEYEAVTSHHKLREQKKRSRKDKDYYIFRDYSIFSLDCSHQSWEVIVLQNVRGNVKAAIETYMALETFRPSVALFLGVAGGFEDKRINIGDVVVANKIYWYESGKEYKKSSENVELTSRITGIAIKIKAEQLTQKYELENFSIHPKPIASGEKVLTNSNSEICQFIKQYLHDSVAVETEGYGFLKAAKAYSEANHRIEALVIRGISDLIDNKERTPQESQDDERERQKKATYNAATLAFEVLNELEVKDIDFAEIITNLEKKIHSLPEHANDNLWFEEILDIHRNALQSIASEMGNCVHADRTTVFFLTEDQQQLWSIFAENKGQGSLEIRVPVGNGVAGKVAEDAKKRIVIREDLSPEEQTEIQKQDDRTGYKTKTLLTIPLFGEGNNPGQKQKIIAVIQFVNKLKQENNESILDNDGFTESDYKEFAQYESSIVEVIEKFMSYYKISKKMQAVVDFTKNVQAISQGNQSLEETLQRVMQGVKDVTKADRSTVWIFKPDSKMLWTKIKHKDGSWQELNLPPGEGFAGQSAALQQAVNIPCDVYKRKGSEEAKKTDKKTKYRTCSLLCMPLFSNDDKRELIGVSQLVNKRLPGTFIERQEYEFAYWKDKVPEVFNASFTEEDEKRLRAYNEQVAVAIQTVRDSSSSEHNDSLYQLLKAISAIVDNYIQSEQTVFLFLDDDRGLYQNHHQDKREFWTVLLEKSEQGDSQLQGSEMRIPAYEGTIGKVFKNKKPIINNDFLTDPYLDFLHEPLNHLEKNIRNLLIVPLCEDNNQKRADPFALVLFINKKGKPQASQDYPLFTAENAKNFIRNSQNTIALVKAFCGLYATFQEQQQLEKFKKALNSVTQPNLSEDEQIKKVLEEAKNLVDAHRSTLWVIDDVEEPRLLDGTSFDENDNTEELPSTKIGQGYVGRTAEKAINEKNTKNIENIPFDIYEDQHSQTSKDTDAKTGYRTCSLMCVPIRNLDQELVGVLQLVNKKRKGFQEYDYENPVTSQFYMLALLRGSETLTMSLLWVVVVLWLQWDASENHTSRQDEPEGKNHDLTLKPAPNCFRASFSSSDEKQIYDFNVTVGNMLSRIKLQEKVK
ncbi:MAG: GAF domain-containing protein [Symploca sp. SIO3E6]|nr:GAF domain-containing protein [Caldora sp. SIO3E6]